MLVAIYQCHACHTEVLGFLLDALANEGHQVIVYNDPHRDPSSCLDFYQTRLGRRLDVRPCHALSQEHVQCDRIIMTTADDPISQSLLDGCAEKIIAIQHERGWHRTWLPCHVGLSPYVSNPFLFPVHQSPPLFCPAPAGPSTPARAAFLHLAIVGHVTHAKHLEEISAFLASSTRTRLTFLSRQESQYVQMIRASPGNAGRVMVADNLPTRELVTVLESADIDAIWTPVRKNVDHSSIKLTGALPLAFNLRKRLVVPDMLASAYGLGGAVVVYDSGVAGFLDMLGCWDARTAQEWERMSQLADAFVVNTVASNTALLRRMLVTL